MTPSAIVVTGIISLTIIALGITLLTGLRWAISAVLGERARQREAEEARDKRRSMELAGIISDLRDGQSEALRVAGDVIKGVVESANGTQRSEADILVQQALERMSEQGAEDQLDDSFHFDDFAGSVPYEREMVGELRPGEGIPGIGLPNDMPNMSGEEF